MHMQMYTHVETHLLKYENEIIKQNRRKIYNIEKCKKQKNENKKMELKTIKQKRNKTKKAKNTNCCQYLNIRFERVFAMNDQVISAHSILRMLVTLTKIDFSISTCKFIKLYLLAELYQQL